MKFNLIFLISSYFLVFLGFMGLLFTGELSYYYLVLAAFSFILAVLGEAKGGTGFLPSPLANIIMLGVFALTAFSIFILKTPPVQELVHFLLALQAVKLSAPKKQRDWLQLYLLSFFSVVSAAALSVELSFAVIFVSYLFAAPWVLVVFHLKVAMETAGKNPETQTHLLSWPLFRLMGKISCFLFLLMALFFLALPRFGASLWGNSWATGVGMTGFSDRLSLGDVSEIKKNNAVAMRVIMKGSEHIKKEDFYWRGISLDRFDGKKWDRSDTRLTRIRRVGETYLVGEGTKNRSSLVQQEIILEPTGSQALFALGRPAIISGRLRDLYRDSMGNLRSSYPFSFQISYKVLSSIDPNRDEEPAGDNFLQIPEVDPRIGSLTRRITAGIEDPVQKAKALEGHLRNNYHYTLKGLAMDREDPLGSFLFDVRQGDCEYFSSAMTIMLRILKIPARVVNGYIGGDWNPYGEYYVVRQSDAHSWVEAYFGGKGWVTLDPTPPYLGRERESLFDSMADFIDYMRMRWYRYVVNFGFGDQYRLFSTLSRPSSWIDPARRGLSMAKLRQWLRFDPDRQKRRVILLVVLVLAWWVWRQRRKFLLRRMTHPLSHEAAERYQRLLNLLRKRGLRKKPGETPDEFSRMVNREQRGLIKEFTELYQRARFSSLTDFSDGFRKMDEIMVQLVKSRINSLRPWLWGTGPVR